MSNPTADIQAQLDALSAEANADEQQPAPSDEAVMPEPPVEADDIEPPPPPEPDAAPEGGSTELPSDNDQHDAPEAAATAVPDATEAEVAAADDDAAPPAEGDEGPADLAGEAFAEQVQRLLDEAAAKGQLPDEEAADADTGVGGGTAEPAGNASPAGEASADPQAMVDAALAEAGIGGAGKAGTLPAAEGPAPDADAAADGGGGMPLDDDALMQQIDSMLAEHAEQSLEGDFASVDEITAGEPATDTGSTAADWGGGPAQAPDPSNAGAPSAASDNADDELAMDGDFESVESLSGADPVPAAATEPAQSSAEARPDAEPEQPALTPGAQALAEELDADEAEARAGGGGATDLDDTTEAAAHLPASDAASDDADDPAAAKKQRQPLAATAARLALQAMRAVNQPIMGLAPLWREVVGLIGLGTLAWAIVLMVKAAAGALAATISAALVLPLVAVLAVRILMRAGDSDGAEAGGEAADEPA